MYSRPFFFWHEDWLEEWRNHIMVELEGVGNIGSSRKENTEEGLREMRNRMKNTRIKKEKVESS